MISFFSNRVGLAVIMRESKYKSIVLVDLGEKKYIEYHILELIFVFFLHSNTML